MRARRTRARWVLAVAVVGLVASPGGSQAQEAGTRENPSAREVALSLVRLIHLQKVCPPFMSIDQGLASVMVKNLLVRGYEEFGAETFEKLVVVVSDEFTRSLARGRDGEWCAEQREDYRRQRRDGFFR